MTIRLFIHQAIADVLESAVPGENDYIPIGRLNVTEADLWIYGLYTSILVIPHAADRDVITADSIAKAFDVIDGSTKKQLAEPILVLPSGVPADSKDCYVCIRTSSEAIAASRQHREFAVRFRTDWAAADTGPARVLLLTFRISKRYYLGT